MDYVNEATLLLARLLAVVACFYLARKAPDWVQLGILAIILISMSIHTWCAFLELYGVGRNGVTLTVLGHEFTKVWPVRLFASAAGDIALLVYLVRQMWLTTGVCAILKPRGTGDAT